MAVATFVTFENIPHYKTTLLFACYGSLSPVVAVLLDFLSNKIRNKKCTIMDCRGSEEEGFEYLIDVGKFPTLRMWLDEEYIDL